jgi:hypothetical protein
MDQLKELIGSIIEEHTLIAYGQMFILTNGARALMDPCDWYTFRWMRRTMWHSVFPKNPDECLFNLCIDNGMITRLIPYETEARPNYWRYQFRHVPVYRDYRFLVDDALQTHRAICGPLVEYPMVPQHVLSLANQSIHVPNFAFYAVWYTASNSWGSDAIFTGWSNDLQEYILMDWIPEYSNMIDIPSVDEFSMTLYSGAIGDRGRIPFPDLQNVTNFYRMPTRSVLEGWPVFHRMSEIDDIISYIIYDDDEECKMERSFENNAMYLYMNVYLMRYTNTMMATRPNP